MNWLKSFIFYTFLTLLKVGGEILGKDDSHENPAVPATSLPIVLQLSKSLQPVAHEISQPKVDKNNNHIEEHTNYPSISNDIEVFNDKLGPRLEKQDAEPETEAEEVKEAEVITEPEPAAEAEPESEPETETAAEAEAEPAPEPAPETEAVAEPEAEPVAEPEAEPAAEAEAQSAAEAEAEPEPEPVPQPEAEEPKAEEETPPEPPAEEVQESVNEPEPKPETQPAPEEDKHEDAKPDEAANPPQTAVAVIEDAEMPNDEPAKEEEKEDKKDESPVTHVEDAATKIIDTTTAVKEHAVSCFTCTSVDDLKCIMNATRQASCPKVSEGDAGKHNGCYTLYRSDTNITMRGCVDDLAEEGLKYCLGNEKYCNICYENGCNNKEAPSKANYVRISWSTMLFFNVVGILIIKKLINLTLI